MNSKVVLGLLGVSGLFYFSAAQCASHKDKPVSKKPVVAKKKPVIAKSTPVKAVAIAPAAFSKDGATIAYQLPVSGPLPKTYRVSLAITDPKNPNWIVSSFLAGAVREVNAKNKGKFTETWNGLDDNFMPVPPGNYGVKGIYMPAKKWRVDNEFHTVTPKFLTGASAFLPTPDEWQKGDPFGGDPVGSPLMDVAVGADGIAVFYYRYLENGTNAPMFDLKKPVGLDQFLGAFNSGGAAGGEAVTTDGKTVWAFSADGGPKYVFRTDGQSFGSSPGANRGNSYLPQGWVTAMANWHNGEDKPFVYVAQRNKIVPAPWGDFYESPTEGVNKITIHDGTDGKVLAELPIAAPQGLSVHDGVLYILSKDEAGYSVVSADLKQGVPDGNWSKTFNVPKTITPSDLEIDSHGRFYLSDSAANKVWQLDKSGKVLLSYGKTSGQITGKYDPDTFMAPAKLATWTDKAGNDRLIVVESAGPNRVSEWDDKGNRVREFLTLQTKANDGYAIDPEHPEDIYIPGHQGWLTRFKVDYNKRTWKVDAVWPNVGIDPRCPNLWKPILLRANGKLYLAGSRSYNVYRLDNDGWKLSAGLLQQTPTESSKWTQAFWSDTNGNGRVDEDETRPTQIPPGVFTYHGQNWTEDFSLISVLQGQRSVSQLKPSSFDSHGNPVFKTWKTLLTDSVFENRLAGKADATHGGNELADDYSSDWSQADGSPKEGYYVQARGGRAFDANAGTQYKISRYVPVADGKYQMKWRVGRAAINGLAQPGEMYGGMRIDRPINKILSVVDQSRCGIVLYTDDGMYIDTLFTDERRQRVGIYTLPGEFFAGKVYPNKDNGKIYIALGKFTPMLYEMEGWSTTQNPVKPLTAIQRVVTIRSSQIGTPPEIALSVRGGSGAARVARFVPALGGAALDGSMTGWSSSEPVKFQSDQDQNVEVRALYDPQNLYLRWHARFATKFEPRPLPPTERTFTHDQKADTLSFYIQGDPAASPGGAKGGRPGDARFVFGLFDDKGQTRPVAVGFYPEWTGAGAKPQSYRTPVGQTHFAHVANVPGAQLGYTLDEDGKGYVLAASIPRSAIPALKQAFGKDLRTLVNFEATYGGHNKFWWANSDGSASRETYDEPSEARLYPGSWAPAQFAGLEDGVIVRNWQIIGPFGGPGAEKFTYDPAGGMKDEVRNYYEAAKYPLDDGKVDLKETFKGEQIDGWWNKNGEIGWRPATTQDLDTRVILGPGSQVWYGATWIHVPADTELEFDFQGHLMTPMRWTLNNEPIELGPPKEFPLAKQVASKTLTLKAGWNQVMFRGYCFGFPPFRAGLVLKGPQEKLWTLGFKSAPPAPDEQ